MRLNLLPASAFGLLVATGASRAQSAQIEREVEARLWLRRALARVEAATGATPLVACLALLAVALALAATLWLWRNWRKRAG
jgi:hypothetical protein